MGVWFDQERYSVVPVVDFLELLRSCFGSIRDNNDFGIQEDIILWRGGWTLTLAVRWAARCWGSGFVHEQYPPPRPAVVVDVVSLLFDVCGHLQLVPV